MVHSDKVRKLRDERSMREGYPARRFIPLAFKEGDVLTATGSVAVHEASCTPSLVLLKAATDYTVSAFTYSGLGFPSWVLAEGVQRAGTFDEETLAKLLVEQKLVLTNKK